MWGALIGRQTHVKEHGLDLLILLRAHRVGGKLEVLNLGFNPSFRFWDYLANYAFGPHTRLNNCNYGVISYDRG